MTLRFAFLLILASFVWLIGGGLLIAQSGLQPVSLYARVGFGGFMLVFIAIYLTGTAFWAKAKGHHPLWGIALNVLGPIAVGIIMARLDANYFFWSIVVMPLPGLVILLLLPDDSAARLAQDSKAAQVASDWELKNLDKRVAMLEQLSQAPPQAATARQRIEFTGNSIEQYRARTVSLLNDYHAAATQPESQQAAAALLKKVRSLPE